MGFFLLYATGNYEDPDGLAESAKNIAVQWILLI
jgi:hypothetical protein